MIGPEVSKQSCKSKEAGVSDESGRHILRLYDGKAVSSMW